MRKQFLIITCLIPGMLSETFLGAAEAEPAKTIPPGPPSTPPPVTPPTTPTPVVPRVIPAAVEVKGHILPSGVQWLEVEEIIKAQLSPQGKANYVGSLRKVIVVDVPSAQEKISQLLEQLRSNPINLQLTLDYQNMEALKSFGLQAHAPVLQVDHKGVHAPKGVDIHAHDQKTERSENTSLTLLAGDRCPATLWSTTTVVDVNSVATWNWLAIGPGGQLTAVSAVSRPVLREIGVTMQMMGTYLGDGLVKVEVFPVITGVDGTGHKQSFRVDQVVSTVTVRNGQRVFLGGANRQMQDFMSSLFNPIGVHKDQVSSCMNMYLTVKVEELKAPGTEAAPRVIGPIVLEDGATPGEAGPRRPPTGR